MVDLHAKTVYRGRPPAGDQDTDEQDTQPLLWNSLPPAQQMSTMCRPSVGLQVPEMKAALALLQRSFVINSPLGHSFSKHLSEHLLYAKPCTAVCGMGGKGLGDQMENKGHPGRAHQAYLCWNLALSPCFSPLPGCSCTVLLAVPPHCFFFFCLCLGPLCLCYLVS